MQMHGDIKLPNIVFDSPTNRFTLVDLGTAFNTRTREGFTDSYSWGYLDPWMAMPDAHGVRHYYSRRGRLQCTTHKTDVFNVGVCLLRLLLGSTFPAELDIDNWSNQQDDQYLQYSLEFYQQLQQGVSEFPAVQQLLDELSERHPDCHRLLLSCLAVDPAQRPSLSELAAMPFIAELVQQEQAAAEADGSTAQAVTADEQFVIDAFAAVEGVQLLAPASRSSSDSCSQSTVAPAKQQQQLAELQVKLAAEQHKVQQLQLELAAAQMQHEASTAEAQQFKAEASQLKGAMRQLQQQLMITQQQLVASAAQSEQLQQVVTAKDIELQQVLGSAATDQHAASTLIQEQQQQLAAALAELNKLQHQQQASSSCSSAGMSCNSNGSAADTTSTAPCTPMRCSSSRCSISATSEPDMNFEGHKCDGGNDTCFSSNSSCSGGSQLSVNFSSADALVSCVPCAVGGAQKHGCLKRVGRWLGHVCSKATSTIVKVSKFKHSSKLYVAVALAVVCC